MNKRELKFIILSFLIWKTILFIFLFLAIKFVPLQRNFLGGGIENYLRAPWLWAWLNFDGEHYLSLVQIGYQPLTFFFFPVFPLVVKLAASFAENNLANLAAAGLLVSNLCFFMALIGFWKLAKLEFNVAIAKLSIILLLLFPMSFYFGSYYTESIFLMITVWSFYFVRSSKWAYGGILGAVSSATRIVGLALLPAFLVEFLEQKDRKPIKLVFVLLIPIGILAYMFYLKAVTGNPLDFITTISMFGSQRSSSFILLPQVFFRYFVKVLPSLNYLYFPGVFTAYLEIITALLFLGLSILAFWKLRKSYATYLALGFLIPTLSGSFSSLPRYVMVLFPAFILLALYFSKLPKYLMIIVAAVLLLILGIASGLFFRGYWIA